MRRGTHIFQRIGRLPVFVRGVQPFSLPSLSQWWRAGDFFTDSQSTRLQSTRLRASELQGRQPKRIKIGQGSRPSRKIRVKQLKDVGFSIFLTYFTLNFSGWPGTLILSYLSCSGFSALQHETGSTIRGSRCEPLLRIKLQFPELSLP